MSPVSVEDAEGSMDKDAPINKKSYQARLGLARVLAKLPDSIEESRKYYNQVIDMAPEVGGAVSKVTVTVVMFVLAASAMVVFVV